MLLLRAKLTPGVPVSFALWIVALAISLSVTFPSSVVRAFPTADMLMAAPMPDGSMITLKCDLEMACTEQAERMCGLFEEPEIPWGSSSKCQAHITSSVLEAKLFRYFQFVAEFDRAVYADVQHAGIDTSLYENLADSRYAEGTSLWFPAKLRALARALEDPAVQTYCETGFNGGHSAALALILRPDVQVVSFDLGMHIVTAHAVTVLQGTFPRADFNVIMGDSRRSIPGFTNISGGQRSVSEDEDENNGKGNPVERTMFCDIIYIDGGHTEDIAFSDLRSFKRLARRTQPETVVVIDDVDMQGPRSAWRKAIAEGWVEQTSTHTAQYSECPKLTQDPDTFHLYMEEGIHCDEEERVFWRHPTFHYQDSEFAIGRFMHVDSTLEQTAY